MCSTLLAFHSTRGTHFHAFMQLTLSSRAGSTHVNSSIPLKLSLPLPTPRILFRQRFHHFVAFQLIHILPGTVKGLKNNLTIFASTYEVAMRVASS